MQPRRITIEVLPEDTIESLAEVLVRAYIGGSYVYTIFNGVVLTIGGGDTPDDVIRKYQTKEAMASMKATDFFSKERLSALTTFSYSAARAMNAVRNENPGDATVGEFLAQFPNLDAFKQHFLRMPNMGAKSVDLMILAMQQAGLSC